jgi:hypothetical protein
MRFLGMVTAIALAAITALGVVIGVRSIPDVRRYLRIRSM